MGRPGLRGFTLIEMVVVVAIVGVLAAAARPFVELSARRVQELQLRHNLRLLRDAIDRHKQAAEAGRIVVKAQDSGYPPTLDVLVEGVPEAVTGTGTGAATVTATAGRSRIYFLRRMPRDPFADASLPAAQTWQLRSYDSPPDAPRPGRDVFDVSSASPRIGLDGTPVSTW